MNLTPKQAVKQINAHCDKGNGIYTNKGGRCFRAMLIKGLGGEPQACVTPDFGKSWLLVDETWTFWDGNWSHPIGNLPGRP